MNTNKGIFPKGLLLVVALMLVACDKDFSTIGADVFEDGDIVSFSTGKFDADVFVYTRALSPVRTDDQPIYQLGSYNDVYFGKTQATIASQMTLTAPNNIRFGSFTQEQEDEGDVDNASIIQENETIKRVFIDIPFFARISGDTEDVMAPNGETVSSNVYELDSIFGNQEAFFDIKVEELTFYLRDLDPDTDFQQAQEYFSNQDFVADGHVGQTLASETMYQINGKEVLIFDEDDPDTPDADESGNVQSRFSPRIRLDLDANFFQQNLLDNEGSDLITNANNFKEFLRGVIISTSNFSEDVLMLLNFPEANITVEYNYDVWSDNDTPSDESDDFVDLQSGEASFELSLSPIDNNVVNTYIRDPYPTAVTDAIISTDGKPENFFVKGGEGLFAEIKLFDEDDDSTVNLDEVKNNGWLINEANLTFYIDQETLTNGGANTAAEPRRLYLYDITRDIPLFDYFLDPTVNTINADDSRTIHGGKIEFDDDGKGTRYKIRLTEHVNNLLRRDSTNVRLGLVVTSDINLTGNVSMMDMTNDEATVPFGSVINPLGTVLHGSSDDVPEDVRLKLEIFYTDPNESNN